MTARCSGCGRYRESEEVRLRRIETNIRLAKEMLAREETRLAWFVEWVKREVMA